MKHIIRESIVNPHAKIVAGFQAIMPTYQGQISEEGLLQLIAYIKSLQQKTNETTTAASAPTNSTRRGEEPMNTETKPRMNYLNVAYGVKSWLLTVDHKRIALLYLGSITLFFFLGGALLCWSAWNF